MPRPALRARTEVRIGCVPLTDSAPLMLTRELGLFAKHGLDVVVTPELGWASIREKILYQDLDAAHAPAPMLYRLLLGLDGKPCEVFTSCFMNADGNAVTLGMGLRRMGIRSAADLKRLIRSKHPERLDFAVISLYSTHLFLLRRWLLSGGIDPDKEVLIAVLPPAQMLGSLQNGPIKGFCCGEPWNSAAVIAGSGWRPAMVDILSSQRCFREVRAALRPALQGPFDCDDGNRIAAAELLRFHGPTVNAPTGEKAVWLLAQTRHARLLTVERPPPGAFRPDLLEEALGPPVAVKPVAPRKKKAASAAEGHSSGGGSAEWWSGWSWGQKPLFFAFLRRMAAHDPPHVRSSRH